ncbi:hypothetical protein B0H11DRAFT_2247585 [Mycena galericulata]|nr:hypothetical protein B0H11DRAFT_2247585 [Mycena galericulata]
MGLAAFALLTLATSAFAQSQLSSCALTCLTNAASASSCSSIMNLTCICTNANFLNLASSCLTADCTAADVQAANALESAECAGISPTSASSAASVPSKSSSATIGSGSSSGASNSAATSTSSSSGFSGTAGFGGSSATPTPSGTAGNSEIAGGVVGGLVLLVCLAAAFRWRQRAAQPHAPDIDQGTLKLGGGAVRPTWLGGAVAQPSASAGGNPLSEADMAAQLRALTDKVEHLERERREATRSPNATGAGNDASSGMPWYGGASGGASRDRDALEAMKRQQTSVVIQDQEKAKEAPPTYLAAWGGS